ncbi:MULTISPECIES: LuxR C-terminal-related transcriptional regulator [unclassified Rhizobium]|uniref:helix-turn-helix transcriptional regulator n=1 Tax=unclassified Rhizobium TaxID=2613769 RepID=UPI000EA96DD4|nr:MULTISPECIES: LuxR C-terminal-related transcriptional regulator [unclassified Rhizobium]AYG68254.1 LuxR family transcriptional regulator [Rhizobium sp. CCGE531]AYG74637.1 LuxR family transcriptional regulator [Rhizobium sp. CCGE532]
MSYIITAERQLLLSAELATARTQAAFALALERTGLAFGFSHMAFMNAPVSDDAMMTPLLIEGTVPAQFVRDFDRQQLVRRCPMLLRTRDSVLPRSWHLLEKDTELDSDLPREIYTLLINYNCPMSVIIPVNSPDGQRLLFWFMGNRNSLGQSELNELTLIMLQALDSYNCLKRSDSAVPHSLSARELEVVRWTAQGKTSVEIGQILSLSDHTVNAYMMNAIKKLDCVNRTQLVAKAIRLKLIS